MKWRGVHCVGWLLLSVSVASAGLDDGLVAYYPFDGDAKDAGGHSLNGTVHGATLTKDQHGADNAAYAFDGVTSYIYFGNVLPDMNEMTVSMWVRCEEGGSGTSVFVDSDWAPRNDTMLGIAGGNQVRLVATKGGGALDDTVTTAKPLAGTWRHVVWVLSSAHTAVYIDGDKSATLDKGGANHGFHNFLLGTQEYPRGRFGYQGYWKGAISSLRIYDRALSDTEISELYDQDKPPGVDPRLLEGLVAYYPFDGDAKDYSGNGLDGTVHGATPTRDQHYQEDCAYEFDGVDDYIYFGNILPDMQEFAVSMWLYNSGGTSTILIDGDWQLGNDVLFTITGSGGVSIRADKNGARLNDLNISTGKDLTNRWMHIVWVATGSQSLVYLDGQQLLSVNKGGSNVGYHDFILGTEEFPQGRMGWHGYWKGKLSSLRIYNRVLSASEVQDLFLLEVAFENEYVATLSLPDLNGNGTPELAALSHHPTASSPQVVIKDSQSAEAVKSIAFFETDTSGSSLDTLQQGLVAHYPFDGDAGDISGFARPPRKGTVYGATLTADQRGVADSAYEFDGSDDYITLGSAFPDMQEMTLCIWLYQPSGLTGLRNIFVDAAQLPGVKLLIPADTAVEIHGEKNGYRLKNQVKTNQPVTGRWVNITWVMTGSYSLVYIDGVEAGRVDVGGSNVGQHAVFLAMHMLPGSGAFGSYWKGRISSLRIYNRPLTRLEIAELYCIEAPSTDASSRYRAAALARVHGPAGDRPERLAVLGVKPITGRIDAQIRDLITGQVVNTIPFLGENCTVLGFTSLADLNGNGVDELSVLGKNQVTGDVFHQVKDAATGETLNVVPFPR